MPLTCLSATASCECVTQFECSGAIINVHLLCIDSRPLEPELAAVAAGALAGPRSDPYPSVPSRNTNGGSERGPYHVTLSFILKPKLAIVCLSAHTTMTESKEKGANTYLCFEVIICELALHKMIL